MAIDYSQYPVLFVDDEEPNRIVFRASFGQDFQTLLASNAEEALAILRETPVAVMIADQRMPGMSGVELAEKVRVDYPDVIRIIITAYTDIQAAIDAINRGQVARYISKPWNSTEVRNYLRSAIDLYQLTRRVQELQGQVLRAERLATLGLAASSIAHDMGGPVACLLNDLDGMEQELESLLEEGGYEAKVTDRLHELLDVAQCCKSSVEEISRILSAVRGSIRSRPRREPVPLITVVRTATKLTQTEVVHKAAFRVDCDPEVAVEGDGAELTQVMINLLMNAANAIPYGHQMENTIELWVGVEQDQAVIKVRDTGCGIPPEILNKIFEPLFTTRLEEGGTGLGLSISKRIVDSHNGTIAVDSTIGKGTVFTVKFPRCA